MSEPTALDWWAVEDAPDVSTTLREADLHCEARYLDEAMRRHQALAARVAALEGTLGSVQHIVDTFCANLHCDQAKAEGKCPAMVLSEQVAAALRPGAPREEGDRA